MSETLPTVLARIDLKKYIDQMEDELKKTLEQAGPGKTPQEKEQTRSSLQALIRSQADSLAKELGLSGSHVLVFMIASTILTTAWVSFALRRETLDLSKTFEDRLTLTDMLNALELALSGAIATGSNYADMSKK